MFLCELTASAADAATFCVHTTAAQHCVGTSEPDLQTALDAAKTAPNDTHRNRVMVGSPGPAPVSGYSYNTPNPTTNPVDIVGAGQGTTTLTYSGSSPAAVLMMNGDGSSVSSLRIFIPGEQDGTGLSLSGGSATGILVTSPGPQATAYLTAVNLMPPSTASGPRRSFTRSEVELPRTGSGIQVPVSAAGAVVVSDDVIVGQNTNGALTFGGAPAGYPKRATARRVRATVVPQSGAGAVGLLVANGAEVNADNLSVSIAGGGGSDEGALVGTNSLGQVSRLNLNHASFYGNAHAASSPGSYGVYTSSNGGTATANVRNSIIRNFFYGTFRFADGAGSVANVRYDYSDYDVLHKITSNSSGGTGTVSNGTGNLDIINPLWLNPAAGDFRIPATSPVINSGDPARLKLLTESATDVLGRPRISNHRRDMGAVEFQFPPPRLRLLTGEFDPTNGKVRLPARCKQPATDTCRFKLKLKATLKRKVNGHTKKKKVTLSLAGSAAGGRMKTLTAKLPAKVLPFVAGRSKLKLAASGTVTDNEAAVAKATGKVTLKAGLIP